MMKITIFALAVLALVLAQDNAQPAKEPVKILKQDSEVDIDGYKFDFETSDGTARQEQGDYKNDTDQQGLSVKGSYQYVDPEGHHIAVHYIADKNGYQPTEEKDGQQSSGAPAAPAAPAAAAAPAQA